MGFWEKSWKCFMKKIPANFQKRFFWQSFYKMGLNWYYYLRTLKKLELWGLLQNYMGVFGKKFHRFQERSNWKSSCSMISNILTVKKAQNFSEGSNFSFFSGKTEGFFEKRLIFLKIWYSCQICSRRRQTHCICLRSLKTKTFRF